MKNFKINNAILLFCSVLLLFSVKDYVVEDNNTQISETENKTETETKETKHYSVGRIQDDELHKNVIEKEYLIKKRLLKKGYKVNYLIISTHRNEAQNEILPLSAKGSFHLSGKAIDFLILDINDDGSINQLDVDLFVNIVNEVEKDNPTLIGGIGRYKKFYAKQMVHIDVRGYSTSWYN